MACESWLSKFICLNKVIAKLTYVGLIPMLISYDGRLSDYGDTSSFKVESTYCRAAKSFAFTELLDGGNMKVGSLE